MSLFSKVEQLIFSLFSVDFYYYIILPSMLFVDLYVNSCAPFYFVNPLFGAYINV